MFKSRVKVNDIKQQYKRGTRLELISMGYDPRPILPGVKATVNMVDDNGTIHCVWDNGRILGLIPGEDTFCVIEPEQVQEENQNLEMQMGGLTQ